MSAYLVLTLAVLSRLVPSLVRGVGHNLTLVGGSLLFFGAKRPRREFLLAALAFAATDVALTTVAFHMPFHAADYALTWLWYLAIPLVGHVLLHRPASAQAGRMTQAGRMAQALQGSLRGIAAIFASATSFFLLSNGQVWLQSHMYPHTAAGLTACYAAGLPFYRNDLVSTGLAVGALFGLPALARVLHGRSAVPARA